MQQIRENAEKSEFLGKDNRGIYRLYFTIARVWPSGYYGQIEPAFHTFEESQQPIQKARCAALFTKFQSNRDIDCSFLTPLQRKINFIQL